VSLAAPALHEQLWFADGETAEGVSETFAIFNPTDAPVQVDAVFLGLPIDAVTGGTVSIDVPADSVVIFDPAESDIELPAGRHSTVFSTLAAPAVVVERVLTRPAGDAVATSVVLGAPPRDDGYVATTWHMGVGPEEPTPAALVAYNVDNVDATITVSAVGPAGPVAVPSLTDIPIGPGAVLTIDLVDPDVLGRELIVESSNRVFVERSLSRGAGRDGRSGSWLLPAG
jgi:hypothetical protein